MTTQDAGDGPAIESAPASSERPVWTGGSATVSVHDLNELINGLPDPLFVKDEAHRWILVNDAFCAFIGQTRAELLGNSDYDFFPTDEADVFWAKDEETFRSDGVVTNEESLTSADGRQRWIMTHKQVFTLDNGERVLVGTIRDMTDLRDMRLRTALAVEAASLGIWTVVPSGIDLDARCAEFLGLDGAGIVTLDRFVDAFEPDIRPTIRADIASNDPVTRSIDTRVAKTTNPGEAGRRTRGARDVHVHFRAVAGGHRVGTLEDITREVHSARELARTARRAQDASRAKSEFLASMSHEIKTPMNAILGYTQLLLRDASLPEDTQRRIDSIHRAGEHLLGLLNDVLDMARIESGQVELRPSVVNVHRLIREVIEVFRGGADARGLNLTLAIGSGTPDFVLADGSKLRQVVVNLIDNALKFTPVGEVRVEVDPRRERRGFADLVIRVRDTGVGISADVLDEIYSPFVRAGDAREPGVGLGLSICRHLVELMDGTLDASSEPGEGSCFTVELRLRTATPPIAADRAIAPPIVGIDGDVTPRVLVVDDRPSNIALLKSVLERVGVDVLVADSGERALELVERRPVDAALVDLKMPGMSGAETARRLRNRLPGLSLVATSAATTDGVDDRLFDASAPKPIDVDALYGTLAELLDIRWRRASAPVSTPDPTPPEALAAASVEPVRALPANARAHLREAVEVLDFDAFVERVASTDLPPQVQAMLRHLAADYAGDELLAILA